MTFTPRLMTARGLLLGVEYRYLNSDRQGKVDAEYIPYDRRFDGARGSFNIVDRATPLPNLYTNLRFEYVSDDSYIRDLSNNLDFLTVNYLERYLDARYQGDWWRALARIENYKILNPALFALTGDPYERLPQLVFDGTWPTGAGGFNYRLHGEVVSFQQSDSEMATATRPHL